MHGCSRSALLQFFVIFLCFSSAEKFRSKWVRGEKVPKRPGKISCMMTHPHEHGDAPEFLQTRNPNTYTSLLEGREKSRIIVSILQRDSLLDYSFKAKPKHSESTGRRTGSCCLRRLDWRGKHCCLATCPGTFPNDRSQIDTRHPRDMRGHWKIWPCIDPSGKSLRYIDRWTNTHTRSPACLGGK